MIRLATAADSDAVQALWEQCFPDETGFNPYFFAHLYRPKYTLLSFCDNTLAAMTQMLPYTLQTKKGPLPVTYIYGACTHPAFRRRHLMQELLHYSFALDQKQGRAGSMLIPQEAWLFDFYRPFGYLPAFSVQESTFAPKPAASPVIRLTADDLSALQTLHQPPLPAVMRTHAQWLEQIALFDALGLGVLGLRNAAGELVSYAFCWPAEDGVIFAQEVMARTPADAAALCSAIASDFGVQSVRAQMPGAGRMLGCFKSYHSDDISNGYFNLMLN